jgi:competence protein ComEA
LAILLGNTMREFINVILGFVLFAFASLALAEPLDINAATAEQLDATMSGIGKVKADAIIQDREKNGRFKSVDDLERVKGIGPAIIEKNRGKITVAAETPPVQPAPAPSAQPAQTAQPVQSAQSETPAKTPPAK